MRTLTIPVKHKDFHRDINRLEYFGIYQTLFYYCLPNRKLHGILDDFYLCSGDIGM